MSAVTIDSTTGCLVIGGAKIFPVGLSEPPAPDGLTRDGRNAWAEVSSAGANLVPLRAARLEPRRDRRADRG